MKKDKIMLILLLVVFIIVGGVMIFFAFQKEEETPLKSDAIKIKEEYEKLNDQTNKSNQTYPTVFLTNENPFVKKTEEEIIEILEKGTGIIYFGFASCPWCRTLMPILETNAKELNIDRVYYLDVQNIRDILELDDSNKPIVKEEGSKGYYKIIQLLDEFLTPYTLTDKENKKIDTGEKRLFAPTIVSVKDGKVMSVHVGTIKSQKSGYDELSDSQKKELTKVVKELMETSISLTCKNEAC